MTDKMREEIDSWRNRGYHIEEDAASFIENLCRRKMEISGKGQDEEYLELMFADEVKNYLVRQAINNIAFYQMQERSEEKDVQYLSSHTMQAGVSKRRTAKTII